MRMLLVLLGALALARPAAPAAPGVHGALPRFIPAPPAADGVEPGAARVELSELRARPGTHLGEEVRFVLQLKELREDWNPYLSRFEPGRWLALEVWPDELFTWDLAVYGDPFTRLFVRRGGGFEPLVRRAHAHQRFAARGRVREAFLGEPWIELLELVPLDEEVGEGTILHVTRARELAFDGDLDLALEQYERARAAPLPPHALAALLEEIRALELRRAEEAEKAPKAPGRPGPRR